MGAVGRRALRGRPITGWRAHEYAIRNFVRFVCAQNREREREREKKKLLSKFGFSNNYYGGPASLIMRKVVSRYFSSKKKTSILWRDLRSARVITKCSSEKLFFKTFDQFILSIMLFEKILLF